MMLGFSGLLRLSTTCWIILGYCFVTTCYYYFVKYCLGMTTVPGPSRRSSSTILSRYTATAEFHDASSAGSTQKFFLLRSVSNVRKLWASMTSVTWWCQPLQLRPS